MERRLYRSRSDRMIAGVFGGLAHYFNIDPTIMRVIGVLILIITGFIPAIIGYIIMAIIVPNEGSTSSEPRQTIKENVEEMKQTADQFGRDVRETFEERKSSPSQEARSTETRPTSQRSALWIGIIVIIVGVLFLLGALNIWWFSWSYIWPALIIVIGILFLITALRR